MKRFVYERKTHFFAYWLMGYSFEHYIKLYDFADYLGTNKKIEWKDRFSQEFGTKWKYAFSRWLHIYFLPTPTKLNYLRRSAAVMKQSHSPIRHPFENRPRYKQSCIPQNLIRKEPIINLSSCLPSKTGSKTICHYTKTHHEFDL